MRMISCKFLFIAVSSVPFFIIQGSALHFHWDFRNMSSNLNYLEIEYNCYNPYVPADGYVSSIVH